MADTEAVFENVFDYIVFRNSVKEPR